MTTLGEQQQTAPHELRGNLLFDRYGASPYWALRGLYQHIDGGASDIEVDLGGETWTVNLGYQQSGLQPRPEDDIDQLYEYRVNAYGEGQRKLPLLIQPRLNWDEDQRPRSVPRDLGLAVNVKLETAVNVEPVDVEALVPWLLSAVCDEVGYDWNDDYFVGPLHEYSCVTQYERYVRVLRSQGKKLVASDGVFYRIFNLLADEEGSKVVFAADNTEAVGYNHQLRLDTAAASKLLPGKQRGKQLKHYHPEHVRTQDGDDPLYHPKVGVAFKKTWNDNRSVPWSQHRELKQELDAQLMNLLSWSGVPTRPGSWYVADDHFESGHADHQVEFVDDPTPQIEQTQESVLVRTLMRASERDIDVLQELAMADGGEVTVGDLEENTPWATSTLYAALERLGDLVENRGGNVRFISAKIRQQVRDIIGRAEDAIESYANAVEDVLAMDPRDLERKGRAWQNYVNRYAANLVERDGAPDELRFRTLMSEIKSLASAEWAQEIVDYGRVAWAKAGRPPADYQELIIQYQTPGGEVVRKRAARLLNALEQRSAAH